MDKGLWCLNIMFLLVIVLFIGISLWLGAEADRAYKCLLDDKCVKDYRAKIENEQHNECGEPRSTHNPTAHPTVIGGRPYVFFY